MFIFTWHLTIQNLRITAQSKDPSATSECRSTTASILGMGRIFCRGHGGLRNHPWPWFKPPRILTVFCEHHRFWWSCLSSLQIQPVSFKHIKCFFFVLQFLENEGCLCDMFHDQARWLPAPTIEPWSCRLPDVYQSGKSHGIPCVFSKPASAHQYFEKSKTSLPQLATTRNNSQLHRRHTGNSREWF